MKPLEKLFFGIKPSWWKVLVFAAVTGVFTGVVMMIPVLEGTSIQNIGIQFEAWILFAVIIATNCEKPLEAGLKVFVFFLVSQPLVYLTMWPSYGYFPWEYYRNWLIWTVLTLPGGVIAWFVKKKNVPGALILSVACGFLAYLGIDTLAGMVRKGTVFGLLTVLFCFAQIVLYALVLMPHLRERLIVFGVSLAVTVVSAVLLFTSGPSAFMSFPLDNAGAYTASLEDDSLCTVELSDDSIAIRTKKSGTTTLTLTDRDGNEIRYEVVIEPNGQVTMDEIR